MSGMMRIHPEPTKTLSMKDEGTLLRAALERDPASVPIRMRLASLLYDSDAFDDVIALLPPANAQDYGCDALMLLASACFAKGSASDNATVLSVTEQAATAAQSAQQRAHALSLHGKALLRNEQVDTAKDVLRQALELDPYSVSAFKRLAVQLLRELRPDEVIALSDRWLAKGICHSRLLAAKSMALAAAGQLTAAHALSNPAFCISRCISAPAGWDSLESFNAAIIAELEGNPAMRFARYGTASEQSWRVDSPAIPGATAIRALLATITSLATEHTAALGETSHPWLASAPAEAMLRSWAVITEGEGHEQWHMHPYGWISGGYYPQVPSAVTNGVTGEGCLAFGLPAGLIGTAAASAFGETLVRPQPGLLTLFPSHLYHRTYPHRTQGRRICIAFDIGPA
jgi:tetratricopeptide (TPR) repeat protein